MFSSSITQSYNISTWYYKNDDEYESSFTSLLTAMSAHRRIEVIEYLATKFGEFIETTIPRGKHRGEYKILAHIYAQRARIRSKSQRLDDNEEKQDSELKKYMQETITVINEEDICEYVLEHMLGMCYLERAKRIGEKGEWTQDMYDELLSNIDKANAFAGTVNGYPATINKSFLDKNFYNILMHAIQTKESVSVKMLEINTQGTGYTLFI